MAMISAGQHRNCRCGQRIVSGQAPISSRFVTEPNGLADHYLELLKGALAHTLYAEVDGGINYRRNILGRALFAMMRWRNIAPVRIGAGAAHARMDGNDWPVFAQTMVSRARIDNLQRCIEDLIRDDVRGDLIETGVWRGGSSIFMRGVLKVRGIDDRTVWGVRFIRWASAASPAVPGRRRRHLASVETSQRRS